MFSSTSFVHVCFPDQLVPSSFLLGHEARASGFVSLTEKAHWYLAGSGWRYERFLYTVGGASGRSGGCSNFLCGCDVAWL